MRRSLGVSEGRPGKGNLLEYNTDTSWLYEFGKTWDMVWRR